MSPRRGPSLPVILASVCLLTAACGGSPSAVRESGDTVGGVGTMPPRVHSLTLPPIGTLASGAVVPSPDAPVGDHVESNRLILIGDSILAGASQRYGGEACDTLVPLGWRVAVEAEVGRQIEFGTRVLDERPPEQWDAAVVFLGTNYNGDEVGYEADLDEILDRLAPRPVVLVTVTNHSPLQEEVNAVIEREVTTRSGIDVFDWTTVSEGEGVLTGDGVHPTDAGRQLLIDGLALLLGRAPLVASSPPECLSSVNIDDSAGTNVPMPSRPSNTSRAPTTVPRVTTPPVTAAPTTTAPTTAPPSTSTAPPATVPVVSTVAPAPDSTAAP